MAGEIESSVRDLITLSGGTRTTVKIDRPWQPKLMFPKSSAECLFCSCKQEDEYVPGKGFKTFKNSYTPFPYHRLLIPLVCWEEQKLRSLGGLETLSLALKYALAEVARTRENLWPTWIYTHIGYGAGQNLTHQHWHLCGAPTEPQPLVVSDYCCNSNEITLLHGQYITTILHGVRAGQVLIVPHDDGEGGIITTENFATNPCVQEDVFWTVHWVIEKFNEKFNYPDYCLFLALNSETDWHFRYTPILNNWGGSEFAALDYGTPFVLPWPHSKTVEYLVSL